MHQQRSTPAQGFSRRRRLTQPEEFAKALKQRALVRNPRFALYVLEPEHQSDSESSSISGYEINPATEPGAWRLGLVVPKRFEASSVRRNAIKRVWREAFRRRHELLELPPYDLVARLLSPVLSPDQSLALLKKQCHDDAEILLQQMMVKLRTQVRAGFSARS